MECILHSRISAQRSKKVSEPPAPQRSTAGRPSATKNSEPGRARHGGELPGPSARAGNAWPGVVGLNSALESLEEP